MKKIISVFLLTVMMLTLLASCGGSGNDTTAADGSQSDVGTSDENGDKLVIDRQRSTDMNIMFLYRETSATILITAVTSTLKKMPRIL